MLGITQSPLTEQKLLLPTKKLTWMGKIDHFSFVSNKCFDINNNFQSKRTFSCIVWQFSQIIVVLAKFMCKYMKSQIKNMYPNVSLEFQV
jgi:hypothetical protein